MRLLQHFLPLKQAFFGQSRSKQHGKDVDDMTKILSIGNSFSQDATRYLQQIAAADGHPLSPATS